MHTDSLTHSHILKVLKFGRTTENLEKIYRKLARLCLDTHRDSNLQCHHTGIGKKINFIELSRPGLLFVTVGSVNKVKVIYILNNSISNTNMSQVQYVTIWKKNNEANLFSKRSIHLKHFVLQRSAPANPALHHCK